MDIKSHYHFFPFQYLYLIFSDDSLISFDEWVFNTEAHPLPVKGKNPLYREADSKRTRMGAKKKDRLTAGGAPLAVAQQL